MADLTSPGSKGEVVLTAGQKVRVSTGGVATVKSDYGAPSGTTTLTAQSQDFGPYGVQAKLTITHTSGAATSYSQITDDIPATALTAAQVGALVAAGDFTLSSYWGAKSDGVAYSTAGGVDNGPALNDMILAAYGTGVPQTIKINDGVWNIRTPIVQYPGVSLSLTKGAVLNCAAAMESVITTPLALLLEDVGISGGTILCNGLANNGVEPKYFRHYVARDTLVEDWLAAGWKVGDPASAQSSYEFIFSGLRTHRRDSAVPSGAIAMYIRAATDTQGQRSVLIGGEVGLQCQSGGSFEQIHAWTRASTGAMKAGFIFTGGGAQIVNCYADTPTENGFDLTGTGYVLINPLVYNNNGASATDNIAVGLRFRTVNPVSSVVAPTVQGADASHRMKNDIVTADGSMTGITLVGGSNINVVTTTRPAFAGETAVNGDLDINGLNNTNRQLAFMTNMLAKWYLRMSGNESGSNNGADMSWVSRTDAGAFLRTDWSLNRRTGAQVFGDANVTAGHEMYGPSLTLKTAGAGYQSGAAVAVASLPAAAAGLAGLRLFVNNALSPVFGSAVAGGGAVYCPVFCTGSAWIVG